MLRRTFFQRVHLFSALVPRPVVSGPSFLSVEEIDAAKTAVQERSSVLGGVPLLEQLEKLTNIKSAREAHDTTKSLSHCVDLLREKMYAKTCTDPRERLQLHEAIMAAGFYERSINVTQLKGENVRFVLNHYNFDVRRDVAITRLAHESLLKETTSTEDSDSFLTDLLLLERRLYGSYRFAATSGRQWMVLGLPVSEITTEEELTRVLDIPAVKTTGNFSMAEEDLDKMWKLLCVTPQPETTTSFVEVAGLDKDAHSPAKIRFDLRVQKPQPPLDFWERLREKLLRYWVIFFAVWVSFWMVDEEVITLVALIVLKHKQTKILEEEAERTGGKVYIASAVGRSRD